MKALNDLRQTTPTPTRQRQRNPAAAGESPNGAPKRRRNNGRKSANGNGSCSNGASPGAEFAAASFASGNPHGNPHPFPHAPPHNPGPNNPGSKGGSSSRGKPYRPTQEAIDSFILEHKDDLHRCGKCKQYFPSREYLQSHLASHQLDTKVKCLHCSEAFDDDETYAVRFHFGYIFIGGGAYKLRMQYLVSLLNLP